MILTSGDDYTLARDILQHLTNRVSVSITLFPKASYGDIKLINPLLLNVLYKSTVTFLTALVSQPVYHTFVKIFFNLKLFIYSVLIILY